MSVFILLKHCELECEYFATSAKSCILLHVSQKKKKVGSAIELLGPPSLTLPRSPPNPPPHTHTQPPGNGRNTSTYKKNQNTSSLLNRRCRLSFSIQLKTHSS